MSKELKYKAWNTESKKMYWFDALWGNHKMGDGYIGMVEIGKPMSNNYSHRGNVQLIDPDNCIFLPFTGLKDENDVNEIYEGCVLKIQLPMGGFWGNVKQEKIGVVRYESDRAGFIVEWKYSKNQHHVDLNCDIACEAKMLGNIYEHPHLVQDKEAV